MRGERGGTRGARGSRGPSAPAAASTVATTVALNRVELIYTPRDTELWDLSTRLQGTLEWINVKRVDAIYGSLLRNGSMFIERVIAKRVNFILSKKFGVGKFIWDGAACVLVPRDAPAESGKENVTITGSKVVDGTAETEDEIQVADQVEIGAQTEDIFNVSVGKADRFERFEVRVQRTATKAWEAQHLEAMNNRLQQAVLDCSRDLMAETGGGVDTRTSNVFIPPQICGTLIGDAVQESLDPEKIQFDKDEQKTRFQADLDAVGHSTGVVQCCRVFEPALETSRGRGGVLNYQLRVNARTQVRIAKTMPLLEFLSAKIPKVFVATGSYERRLATLLRDRVVKAVLKTRYVIRQQSKWTEDHHMKNPRLFIGQKIVEVLDVAADEHMIQYQDKEISNAEYFKERYGITLRYPKLPLIAIGNRDRTQRGRSEFRPLLPPELLVIEAQPLNTFETVLQNYSTNIMKIQPGQGRHLTLTFLQWAFANANFKAKMESFGLTCPSVTLSTVPAHIAERGIISYGGTAVPVGVTGSWNMAKHLVSTPFVVAKGKKILMMDLRKGEDLKSFKNTMGTLCMKGFAKAGVIIPPASVIWMGSDVFSAWHRSSAAPDQLRADLLHLIGEELKRMVPAQFKPPYSSCIQGAFFSVPQCSRNEYCYLPIKMLLEGVHGIPTQAMNANKTMALTVDKGNKFEEHCSKLALGINTKFGTGQAVNHRVQVPGMEACQGSETIFLGCDLTHTSFRGRTARGMQMVDVSIACIVASDDDGGERYQHTAQIQKKVHDYVEDAELLFKRLLERLSRDLTKLKNVFYFRDGADQGSWDDVVDKEIEQLKSALVSVGCSEDVLISSICCVKRTGHKIYPSDPRLPTNVACQAGTVAGIGKYQKTAYRTFFLQPHRAIGNATPNPILVVVLKDDHGWSTKKWSDVTNSMAYRDQVVTLATSLPAPIYYSHKMAERAAEWLKILPKPMDNQEYGVSYMNTMLVEKLEMMPEHCYL